MAKTIPRLRPASEHNIYANVKTPVMLSSSPLNLCLVPFSQSGIRLILASMLHTLLENNYSIKSVTLFIINDLEMRELNHRVMGRHGPTNILSFPGESDENGELAISVDTFRRECLLYNQEEKSYLIFLLAHGMAHLPGLSHGQEHDFLAKLCEISAKDFGCAI